LAHGAYAPFVLTSINARALPRVLKFNFSMQVYNLQVTTKFKINQVWAKAGARGLRGQIPIAITR
jgi:hypothetical protein